MNVKKIAVVANLADSLLHFRGPLLKYLVDKGHDVHVLAPSYSDVQREALREIGVSPETYSIQRTGRNPFADLATFRDLLRWFRRERPDISLTYFIKPNIYGNLAAGLLRTPRRVAMVEGLGFLFTEGDFPSLKRTMLRQVATLLLRAGLGQAQTVLFLNPDDKREFISRGIVRKENAHLLGGIGVDLEAYPRLPLPPQDQPPCFLMIGRLLREKGVREFVEAAQIVRARHRAARFRLVGGLDTNPGAISLAEVEKWQRAGVIEWAGEVSDIVPEIAAASVFVLPSYREGVPRSTQEAMAMGRAVVTTDVPGCRETVESGVNGLLVPVRDPAALADAMTYFCENPEAIAAMGAESYRIATARFDVHQVNGRIYDYLMENVQ